MHGSIHVHKWAQKLLFYILLVVLSTHAWEAQAEKPPKLSFHLDKDKRFHLKLGVEAFARPEWMSNRGDFDSASDDTEFYIVTRLRLKADLSYRKRVGIKFSLQDSRFLGNGLVNGGKVRFYPDSPHLFTREVQYGVTFNESLLYFQWMDGDLRLELGRLRLVYGDSFFVGDPGFLGPGQSFDGTRLILKAGSLQVDALWLLVRESVATTKIDGCKGSCYWAGDDLAGLYIQKKWGRSQTDLYGFFYQRAPRKTDLTAPSRIGFMGARWILKTKALQASLEGQFQIGQHEGKSLLAGSGRLYVKYTLPVALKPFIVVQGLLATGDSNPDDDNDNNFLALFCNRRKFYGLVNLFAISNIMQPTLGIGFKPAKTLTALLDARYTWKFTAKGTLFGGGSHRAFVYDLSGGDETSVGTEINLRIKYNFLPGATLDFGAGAFLPSKALHRRDSTGKILKSFGTDIAYMIFSAFKLKF